MPGSQNALPNPGRRFLLGLLILALLAGAGAASYYMGWNLWAWRHYQEAGRALASGDLVQARTHLLLCLEVWPDSPATHLLAARTLRRLEEYAEAENHLHDYEQLRHSDEAIQMERALAKAQVGDLIGVESELVAAVQQKHIDSPLIVEALAKGYAHAGRLTAGLHFADLWIENQPDNAEAYYLRGLIKERLFFFRAAEDDLRRALHLDPEHDRARDRLARRLVELGEAPEALEHFQRLAEKQPGEASAMLGVARCQSDLGQVEQAQVLLDQLLSARPEAGPVLVERGNVSLRKNRLAEAESYLRRAVRAMPFDHRANYLLARCLEQSGQKEEARACLDRMAQIEADVKRLRVLMRKSLDAPLDLALRCEIGCLLLHNNQDQEGLKWLSGILQMDPGHAPTHQALAAYYQRVGKQAQASRHLQLAGKAEVNGSGGSASAPP